jgi:hypothetical protein
MMSSCTEGVSSSGCANAKTQFKPKVAAAAVSCILALKSSAGCDAIDKCRVDALAGACSDSSADSLCATLVKTCNRPPQYPLDLAGCHRLVDGLNADARSLVATKCGAQTEGVCAGGLAGCINYEIF